MTPKRKLKLRAERLLKSAAKKWKKKDPEVQSKLLKRALDILRDTQKVNA